jgi:hypothetical protein
LQCGSSGCHRLSWGFLCVSWAVNGGKKSEALLQIQAPKALDDGQDQIAEPQLRTHRQGIHPQRLPATPLLIAR